MKGFQTAAPDEAKDARDGVVNGLPTPPGDHQLQWGKVMSREAISCPHCGKTVFDPNALFQHVKAKHGPFAAKVFRQPRETEQSVADELVEAFESGERPEHLVAMFPEAFR